ncbi:MAG: hypothetical protein N2544_04240 [Burkholderiales bacterium]|nr:hypothetical protein [Burkholderiales bacterium]
MKRLVIVLAAALVAGCSWFRSGPDTGSAPRLPPDAVAYQCEQGKRLVVRYPAGGKYALVVLPDREFRLDPVGPGRYSNGRATLEAAGERVSLTDGATLAFMNCAPAAK